MELRHVVLVKALLRFVMIYVNGAFGIVCVPRPNGLERALFSN